MATVSAIPVPASGWLGVIRAVSRPSRLAFGVALLAVLSGFTTYATLTGLVPYNPTPGALIGLLLVNLTLGLSLGALIAWRLVRLWNFAREPRAFELRPPLDAHVSLMATSYQASFP